MMLLAFSSAVIIFLFYCLFNFVRDGKRGNRRMVSILHLGQTREEPKIIVMPTEGKTSRRA